MLPTAGRIPYPVAFRDDGGEEVLEAELDRRKRIRLLENVGFRLDALVDENVKLAAKKSGFNMLYIQTTILLKRQLKTELFPKTKFQN